MGMMLIDPRLLEQLENSTCFGIAHDPNAKECKQCDVQQECAARSAGNRVFDSLKTFKPETEEAVKKIHQKEAPPEKAKKKEKPAKKKKELPEGMPNTKGMSIEELWALLKERGGTCKEYSNPQIQKMRLIMAIKATYREDQK